MNDNLTKNVEFNEQQVTQLQTNISEEEFNFLNRVLSKYRIADEHISELTDEHINGVVDKIKERVSEMKKKMELNPEERTYKDLKWFQPSDETIRNIIKNYGEFCYELDLFGQGQIERQYWGKVEVSQTQLQAFEKENGETNLEEVCEQDTVEALIGNGIDPDYDWDYDDDIWGLESLENNGVVTYFYCYPPDPEKFLGDN